MPKQKPPRSHLFKLWINDDPNFSSNGRVIYCHACSKEVKCEKKYHLNQHKGTALHQQNMNRRSSKQTFLQESSSSAEQKFSEDLCKALVAANIPFWKLENVVFKEFLEKYTDHRIPSESTLRKNYLQPAYLKVMNKIREDLGDSSFWITVDETTDRCGRFMVNVVAGKLDPFTAGKPHLVLSREVEATNSSTIARTVRDALQLLWPTKNVDEKFLLLTTDSASYMLKAAETLRVFYPKMLHITCAAHGLHRLAETVREKFPSINSVISSIKKVFLKSPSRIAAFKEALPDVPLPPQPVVTRWGTWLLAAFYYAEHILEIEKVIQNFDSDDAVAIRDAKAAISIATLLADLAYVKSNFGHLPDAITTLETRGMPLVRAVDIVKRVQEDLKSTPGKVGEIITAKYDRIVKRNPGWNTILMIANVLEGHSTEVLGVNYTPAEIAAFKYAPITSCEVERTFSQFKNILSDKRTSLLISNIEHLLVVYCNC